MRHNKKGRKLGTDYSHTKAMKRSLVSALFLNDRIKTVESRAKEIRPQVDKVITWAKRGDLHSRRIAASEIKQDAAVAKLFAVLGPRYAERKGGYTRVLKAGFRHGDSAPVAVIEFVDRDVAAKGAADKARLAAEPVEAETAAA